MSNRALQELEGLLKLQGDAGGSMAQAQNVVEEQQDFERRAIRVSASDADAPEASFAWPEALVTAIGAGWLLGPAGGLLTGLAQGILGKEAEQNALDEYWADNDVLGITGAVYERKFNELEQTADPRDLDQLGALRTQYETGLRMMTGSPELRPLGQKMFAGAVGGLNELLVKSEAQAIDEAATMDARTRSAFNDLKQNFRVDSALFLPQVQLADMVIELVNEGTGASLTAAIASMPTLINPEAGATSDAEVAIWAGVDGVIGELLGKVKQELGQGKLLDSTRKDIIDVAKQYRSKAIGAQKAKEAKYGDFLVIEKIPKDRWAYFTMMDMVPSREMGPFKPTDLDRPGPPKVEPEGGGGAGGGGGGGWGTPEDKRTTRRGRR